MFVNEISSLTYTTLMYVMHHIIYSFSSGFVSNLKMFIRAETCSWDIYIYIYIYISDNIVVSRRYTLAHLFTFDVPLSQYKTCTRTAVTTQESYEYCCHTTNPISPLLFTTSINSYFRNTRLPGYFVNWQVSANPANQQNNLKFRLVSFLILLD